MVNSSVCLSACIEVHLLQLSLFYHDFYLPVRELEWMHQIGNWPCKDHSNSSTAPYELEKKETRNWRAFQDHEFYRSLSWPSGGSWSLGVKGVSTSVTTNQTRDEIFFHYWRYQSACHHYRERQVLHWKNAFPPFVQKNMENSMNKKFSSSMCFCKGVGVVDKLNGSSKARTLWSQLGHIRSQLLNLICLRAVV